MRASPTTPTRPIPGAAVLVPAPRWRYPRVRDPARTERTGRRHVSSRWRRRATPPHDQRHGGHPGLRRGCRTAPTVREEYHGARRLRGTRSLTGRRILGVARRGRGRHTTGQFLVVRDGKAIKTVPASPRRWWTARRAATECSAPARQRRPSTRRPPAPGQLARRTPRDGAITLAKRYIHAASMYPTTARTSRRTPASGSMTSRVSATESPSRTPAAR